MDQSYSTNPIFVFFLFVVRCLIPLIIMIGVGQMLKRWGLITEAPPTPTDEELDDLENQAENGGTAHGKA